MVSLKMNLRVIHSYLLCFHIEGKIGNSRTYPYMMKIPLKYQGGEKSHKSLGRTCYLLEKVEKLLEKVVNFTLKEYTAASQWKGKLVHAF